MTNKGSFPLEVKAYNFRHINREETQFFDGILQYEGMGVWCRGQSLRDEPICW